MALISPEVTFREQLTILKSSNQKSLLLEKGEYFNLVDEVKSAAVYGDKTKTARQYYLLRRSPSTAVASQSSYASQSTFHASQTTSQSADRASQSADEVTPSTSAAGEITSEADGQSSNRDELVDSDSDGESNHQLSTSQSIQRSRKEAREGILKQAQRMIKRSRLENVPGKVGDNITIPIPLVDRGRGDPRNIVGVIVDRDENDLYKISVKGGILNGKYSRNQFDLCNYALLTTNDVSQDNEISLREAVQCESNCGGQGFLRCNCAGTSRCQTNRCKCFKAKMKCNSRCHSALTCNNKN